MANKKKPENIAEHKQRQNPALQTIEEIVIKRPDLSPEQFQTIEDAMPWIRTLVSAEERIKLEQEYEAKYQEHAKEVAEETKKLVTEDMDKWKREQEPLSEKDIAKLLSQEYVTFDVVVRGYKEKKTREFTICELPQEREDRFLNVIKTTLVPVIQEFTSADFRSALNGNFTEQLTSIIGAMPKALNAVSELVAIVLDPWEEDKTINGEWVRKSLSIERQFNIIRAQVEANHYRNFFSDGFRLFRA